MRMTTLQVVVAVAAIMLASVCNIIVLLAIQISELQGLNSTMESILEILKSKDEDQPIEFLKPRGKQ